MSKLTLLRRLDALERNMSAHIRAERRQAPAAWLAADPRYRAITDALERAGYRDAQAFDPKSGKQVFVGTLISRASDESVEAMKAIAPLLANFLSTGS